MTILTDDPIAAWRAATSHLLSRGGSDYAVLVKFPSGTDESEMAAYDPRSLGPQFDRIRDVANTIFPTKTLANSASRADFYARYLRANGRRRHGRWGTYFERFIAFGPRKLNQLERVIHALASWKTSYRAALYMHVSSADSDKLRPIGAPCLQYLQFNCPSHTIVDLLAVYRNHDFCNKALGNYYGLSRLLNFVCKEAGKDAGDIYCLSGHAYFETTVARQRALSKLD